MKLFPRVASVVVAALSLWLGASAAETNPAAVSAMLDRIGGAGASSKFVTVVDETLATDGKETFVITSEGGKPCIKGSTLSALTTGIGWYLNHYANVNLTWNCPKVNLAGVNLPAPAGEERHSSSAVYRYYLNYCTFSYSMSTWTWDRWQEEIDWMALRGINMPLQIIGLEEVWRKFLMEDYGYSQAEVDAYVAGPCYMAWFGMNNLEGWGGPNPTWWYERQAQLGKQIGDRMRSLGIEPVLPGFCQVPSTFTTKTGIQSVGQGNWCGFKRPHLANPADAKFDECADKFYARVKEVLGESKYYSMDPFHEGGSVALDAPTLYQRLYAAMDRNASGSQWVIQSWQWNGKQRESISNVPTGKLIVLDLFSDGNPAWSTYGNQPVVFSTIFNFGGRTGYFGRAQSVIDGYWNAKTQKSTVVGLGAAPEAIEQTPVVYDLLFELPWCESKPDAKQWFKDYSTRRYGQENDLTADAWELIRTSALNRQGGGQGPHEALMCARPNLNGNKVSTWGFNELYYDPNMMTEAAYKLLEANLGGENYSFDLVDISRQALTDYFRKLQPAINQANAGGDTELFAKRRDGFLQLMLDIDELLNTNSEFMLGHWTERARKMADEVPGTTVADRDWLELNNARQLITTWGANAQAEGGGLRDYSYRQWGGMMKDYYYERWKKWFDDGMKAPNWFQWEWNWAHSNPGIYPTEPIGDSHEVAARVLPKYLSPFKPVIEGASAYYVPRLISTDVAGKFFDRAARGVDYTPNFNIEGTKIAEFAIDFNKNNLYEADEVSARAADGIFPIPADAPVGERRCRITLEDGTVFTFTLSLIEDITEPRTVSVRTSNAAQGSVSIDGTDALSVTNTEIVSILATPTQKYDFDHWEDAAGNNVGNDNPMKYYSKEPAEFTAYFIDNKWGVPGFYAGNESYPPGDMNKYGQYLVSLGVTQGGETTTFFESDTYPAEHFYYVSNRIKAAPGGGFHFNYQGKGDLKYQYLSAYCDLNSDGVFDINSAELLGTKGTYQKQDASVGQGGFDVLLPYDTPTGTTHIRLRFDGAWLDQQVANSWVNPPGAFKPDVATNRVIYEVLLEVNEGVEYPSTVTVKVNNDKFGTCRSENSTNIYNPGEKVILTAFPGVGYQLSHWEDSHGRVLPKEWMNGNMIEFTAFDNADITAILEPTPVVVDNWKFNLEVDDEGDLYLDKLVEAGEPDLDLSAAHCDFSDDIYYINPDVFAGNTVLRSLTLPDRQLVKKGDVIHKTDVIMGTVAPGTGTENTQKVNQLGKTISFDKPFTMKITGFNNGEAYNQWGSVLFANGTNGLANSYANGWSQLYLKKEGTLNVKWDSSAEVNFPVSLFGKFQIVVNYLGNNKTSITVSNASGDSVTKEFTHTEMKAISQFVTNMPQGMWVEVRFSEPDTPVVPGELLLGCSNLMDIHVDKDACDYAVEKNGVVYDKTGANCIAYPEGRIIGGAFSLKTDNTHEFTAAPVKDGDSWSNLGVTTTTQTSNWNTLWTIDADGSLVHYNSGLGVDATGHALSADDAKFAYALSYDEGEPSIAFTNEAGKYMTTSGLSNDAFSFDFYPVTELTVPAGELRTVTFPVNVVVPDDANVFSLDKVGSKGGYTSHIMPGHIIPAGTGVLIQGAVKPFEITSQPSAESPDLLDGTNVDLVLNTPYYILEGENFVRKESGTVPANTGYVHAGFIEVAQFPWQPAGYEPVEIDGWKFDWRESYNENVICLTAAVEAGNPTLDLSKPIEETGDRVVDIDPAMFMNNTDLVEVTLPAARLAHHYYDSELVGACPYDAKGTNVKSQVLQLPQALSGETPWKLTLECTSDGSGVTQWGSGLFATGTNAVATRYDGGFQLYLQVQSNNGGHIVCKYNGTTEFKFGEVPINTQVITAGVEREIKHFTIEFTYSKDAGNNYSMTIKVNNGIKTQSKTLNFKLSEIKNFCAAIPAGVNLDKFHLEGEEIFFPYAEGELFRGCKNLQNIHLAEGADYGVEKDGVVYDLTGENCIAYPEGRLTVNPLRLTTPDGKSLAAAPERDGEALNNLAVTASSTVDSNWNTLWSFNNDGALVHTNSGCGLGVNGTSLAPGSTDSYGYKLIYGSGEPSIALTNVLGDYLTAEGTSTDEYAFNFTPVTVLDLPEGELNAVAFPVNVVVPEGAEVYALSSATAKGGVLRPIAAGQVIPAGGGVLVADGATGFVVTKEESEAAAGVLDGTTVNLVLNEPFYLLEGENFVRHESGTVPVNKGYVVANDLEVAEFPYKAPDREPLEIDGWKFAWSYFTNENEICLTETLETGEPELDLSAAHCDFSSDLYYVSPAVFAGNKDLYSLTLPDQPLMTMYETGRINGTVVPGTGAASGYANRILTWLKDENGADYASGTTPFKYTNTNPFIMKITGYNNGKTYNSIGSVLFANGDDGLADDYTGKAYGFNQFLLNPEGHLALKWCSGTAVVFSEVKLDGEFSVITEYLGNNKVKVTVSNAYGESETKELTSSNTMQSIWRFASYMPEGMWINISFTEPSSPYVPGKMLAGCSNLMDIHVSDACTYAVEKDGVVYGSTGEKCIAYPEGRLFTTPFILTADDGTHVAASPVLDGGELTETGVSVAPSANPLNALWLLGEQKLTHLNSGIHLNATGSALSADHGKFAYRVVYGDGEPSLTFSVAANSHLNHSDGQLALNSTAHKFAFAHQAVYATPVVDGPSVASFPVPVIVPDGATVKGVSSVTKTGAVLFDIPEGSIIPAGHAVMTIGGSTDFPAAPQYAVVTLADVNDNLLRGTNVAIRSAEPFYQLNGENFERHEAGDIIPANSAYIPADEDMEEVERFPYDSSTTETIEVESTSRPAEMFDLMGRRVSSSARHGFFIVGGKVVGK